jgi:regulator of replication initiation timing
VAAVCDLDRDYEPANADTDETVTAVISLREKYAEKDRLLTEMGAELEELSNVAAENENLKQQLEAANKQIETLNKTTIPKNRKDASQTDRTKA